MEEGWHSVSGPVCADCFSDYAIKAFIEANATDTECKYCERSSHEAIAAEMDEVLSFISQGLWREYDIPENCLPYETAEGGWQIVTPDDSHDVFAALDICTEDSGQLLDDLADGFSDRLFVQRDPLALSQADGLKYSWAKFCEQIKHETRFVFFRIEPPTPPTDHAWHPDDEWGEYSPPYQILLGLGDMVRDHQLVKILPARTSIIRARQHAANTSPTTARDLGAPPRERASQSRMSPAGISMFYGAEEEKTAFIETFDPAATDKSAVTFGTLQTTRDLYLLDLTELPQIPSIFDEQNYDKRPALIFLHHFQEELSAPIERDGREHYEYVPTQIVAEYFRRVFRDGDRRIDGLKFKSSRKGAGTCYCIFAAPDNCTDAGVIGSKHMLALQSVKHARIDFSNSSYR